MKLVVDGVFYQLAKSGIARVWSSILPRLARYPNLDIVMLDRGSCPSIDGIENIAFPPYTMRANTAADSLLVDKFCAELGADVFSSTYYTTPTTIPSVLIVYDMIPEVLGFDMSERAWREKRIAISFASYYACISENTRSDLKRFHPSIDVDQAIVTHCGVDREIFYPRGRTELDAFKSRFEVSKPYYILVGSREQHGGYKNGSLVFGAAAKMQELQFDLFCVGGEAMVPHEDLARLTANVTARVIILTDDELACAYAGAEALVFPSLYEGFGMPVVEAMACSCPVISTKCGALGEVLGDAAMFVSGHDEDELRRAMKQVRDPSRRKALVEKGLQQAALYNWDEMARGFHDLLLKAADERNHPAMQGFLHEWKRLRVIQAEVETVGQV